MNTSQNSEEPVICFRGRTEAGDALVLGHLGVRAREEQAPVGDLATARPDLLPVDDEMVTLVDGRGLQGGEIGARIRLGVELAPELLGRQDLLEVTLLLSVGAVDDDGGPDDADPKAIGGRRRFRSGQLVGHDGLLHGSRPAAAVFLRPAHAEIAGLVKLAVPAEAIVERPDLFARQVALEPRAHLLAKGDVLGRVVQIHARSSVRAPRDAIGVDPVLARGPDPVNLRYDLRAFQQRSSARATLRASTACRNAP
jgi:hypothetical protein